MSGNAIERLLERHLTRDSSSGKPRPDNCQTCADLAAVEALLEAAKALMDSLGNPNDPTLPSGTYTLGGPYLSQEHLDALAAAVRRVETGQDDPRFKDGAA